MRSSLYSDDKTPSDDVTETASIQAPVARRHVGKSNNWKFHKLITYSSVITICALFALCLAATFKPSNGKRELYGCDVGGNVWINGITPDKTHSILDPRYPLEITRYFGSYVFADAKAIDICWDLFVGRGFQAVAALVVYHLFRIVMSDTLRNENLMHDEFLALQHSTTSITSLWTYLKGPWQSRGAKSRDSSLHFILLAVSVMYVLLSPTWLAAMTSYQARLTPWLTLHEYDKISFDFINPCVVLIKDGSRIGSSAIEDDHCVRSGTSLAEALSNYIEGPSCRKCYPHANDHSGYRGIPNPQSNSLPTYIRRQPNFDHREDCDADSFLIYGSNNYTINPVLHLKGSWFAYNGTLFHGTELIARGTCLPQDNIRYSWGFSMVLATSFVLTTFVLSVAWGVCLFGCSECVKPEQVDMIFGDLRVALLVMSSIRDELSNDVEDMTEKELWRTVKEQRLSIRADHVGAFMTKVPPVERGGSERRWNRGTVIPRDIPVGSESYRAYMQDGLRSVSAGQVSKMEECHLPEQ